VSPPERVAPVTRPRIAEVSAGFGAIADAWLPVLGAVVGPALRSACHRMSAALAARTMRTVLLTMILAAVDISGRRSSFNGRSAYDCGRS
jgi:uncharacterized membrane protein YoaK (UPF0700 family)